MPRQLNVPWYSAFVECTLPHTECPKSFLYWSAFSVLGGVLKRNVYFKDGLYTIFPNQFIILTSPPGIGKGTAINFAWSLVKDDNISTYKLANTISDRVTAPRILQRIAEGWPSKPTIINNQAVMATRDHSATIFSTELRVLVTASDWMLEFLCESWDRYSYDYDTKNMGSSIIKDMCTSLIGGTVPDYIRGMERDVDASVAGGFTSRCLFIFEDKKSKDLPFAQPIQNNKKSKDLYDKLRNDLRHIATLEGEVKLSTDAEIAFRNYYPTMSPQPDDSDAILNFKSRAKSHILKMCMVLCVARSDGLIVSGQDMKDSIFMISQVKHRLDRVFRGMGASQLAQPLALVQGAIEKYGLVTKVELIRALNRHMTPETLDRVLYVLTTINFCSEQRVGNKVYFKQNPVKKVGGVAS